MNSNNTEKISHYLCSAGNSYETLGFGVLEHRISIQELPPLLEELQGQINEALKLIKDDDK